MLPHILRRGFNVVMAVVMLFAVAGPMMPMSTSAALSESGLYSENFTDYTNRASTNGVEWNTWTHSLKLDLLDGVQQERPAIALYANGDTLIAWQDERNGNADIYAQRLDANGNRLWATDMRVNSDAGAIEQLRPAVAIDSSNRAMIIWVDSRTGSANIFAQQLDASGNHLWANDKQVNSVATSYDLAIAMDNSGDAIVVWCDWNYPNYDVYAQKLGSNGVRIWASDMRVNSSDGLGGYNTDIAVDSSGNAVVVWWRQSHIYMQRLSTAGSRLWSVDVRISPSTTPQTLYSSSTPAVAVDMNGNPIVTWHLHEQGSSNQDRIYAQRLNTNGTALWGNGVSVLSNAGVYRYAYPDIAIDSSGTAVIVSSYYGAIRSQRLNSSGVPLWESDIAINSKNWLTPQLYPKVAISGEGNFTTVWQGETNNNLDIYAQRTNASGNSMWFSETRVNAGSGTVVQNNSDITASNSGTTIVAWNDYRNDKPDIYAQRLDANGNRLWDSDIQINFNSSGGVGIPRITHLANGNVVLVWSDGRNIMAQIVDPNGNRLWATDVRVNGVSGSGCWDNQPDVSTNGTDIWVAWVDTRNSICGIYAQKLNTSGNRLWTNDIHVNSSTGETYQYSPKMSVDNTNSRAIIVWTDVPNYVDVYDEADVYAQSLDPNGNRLWANDIRVNSGAGTDSQRYPTVILDGNGNAIVAWTNGYVYTGMSDRDVFAQKLSPNGSKLWADDVDANLNITPTLAWIDYLDIAIDGSGYTTIVGGGRYDTDEIHISGFSATSNIYVQRLDSNGVPQWATAVRVNSNVEVTEQYKPAITIDSNGNAVVAWKDHRNNNKDIFVQKINMIGGKGWLADLQLIYPDQFYYPLGLAQSRTTDIISGDIRQATLTANAQLNGGNVQFYLTNNGGTNWLTATLGTATVFTTTGSDLRWRVALTGDPVWRNRSPIVTSLRIEYSTQVPYADDYEADDTCAQAKPIATGGAAQLHTFHQQADADWTWFNVVSGTTYILQTTNVGAQAQTRLEFRPACAAPPTGSSISLGNGVTLNFTANQTGPVYVKVFNQSPAVFGPNTAYQLSARVVQPTALAVIIAGHDNAFSAQANITWAADRAYNLFRRAGLGKANIRFLDPNPNRDVDGNGNATDDIAGLPTIENVRAAIQDWPRERGVALGVPLYIYLVDHGLIDHFKANGDALQQQVTATDLNLWLSNLEATTGTDNLNIIIDACYSGSFIDVTSTGLASISGHNRVVIASTTSAWNAYGPGNGDGLYFSNAFFTALENQQSLQASFEAGRQAAVLQEEGQQAWLDDNGDRLFTTTDGTLAANRALQRVTLSGQPPRITSLSVTASNTIHAQVVDDSAWVGVTVDIFAPDYVPPPPDGSGTTRIITVPVATLIDPNADGLFTATYPFTQTGWYRLVAHAEDTEGNLALPVAARVCVNCSTAYLPLVRK